MSLEGTDPTGVATGTPAVAASDPREAAVDRLVALVQRGRGHVAVTGRTAAEAAGLFLQAEERLDIHRGVRLRGAAVDEDAALAALCADKGDPDGRVGHAMRTLVQEAHAAGRPLVVIVTEADRADPVRLERLRTRLEFAPGAIEVTRMVLLGGPKLAVMLRRREARGLPPLVAAVVSVPPNPVAGAGSRGLTPAVVGCTIGATLALAAAIALWPIRAPSPEVPPTPRAAAPGTIPEAPAPLAAAPEPVEEVPAPPATTAVAVSEVPDTIPTPPPVVVEPPATPTPEGTLPPPSPPPDRPRAEVTREAPAAAGPTIQVGAFARAENAEALRAKLAREFPRVYVSTIERDGRKLHRVRVGGFASAAEARAAITALRRAGHSPAPLRE